MSNEDLNGMTIQQLLRIAASVGCGQEAQDVIEFRQKHESDETVIRSIVDIIDESLCETV